MKELKTKEDIEEVLKSKEPVAMFMYAAWCPHCKVMHQPWSELEQENSNIKFCKMESENIPEDMGITGFPTFIYVKDGSVKKKVSGEMSKEELKKQLLGGLRGGRSKRRRIGTRRLRRGVRKISH